ncbi:MAG TPA: hypothetical protein PKZ32_04100 [Candidatus Melainabacteria bacterium]|nr:hypothetical protein [Candidatus Melainabacteria bacterium]
MPATQDKSNSPIGREMTRIDGPLKVTGSAIYTSDHNFPGMLYAVPVSATIANGSIASLDTKEAERMPGVKGIFHRGNISKLFRVAPTSDLNAFIDEDRPPFDDDVIRYFGQYVAVAVAETFLQATAAANQDNFRKAAEEALRNAKPLSQNKFKIELSKRCLTHALKMASTS